MISKDSKLKSKYLLARKNAADIQRQYLLERARSRAENSSSDDSDLESERVAAKAQELAKVRYDFNLICDEVGSDNVT